MRDIKKDVVYYVSKIRFFDENDLVLMKIVENYLCFCFANDLS